VNEVTLSGLEAMKSIWMPGVVVTNRDIRAYELISTSVTITKDGDVTKVERAGVTCQNLYLLEEYPFDTQTLAIKVASSKYMLNEVVLKADEDKSISGTDKEIFKGHPYDLESWKVFAVEETSGALQKSRGVLELKAKRRLEKYEQTHLTPTCLLVAVSWGVFWFPFQNPFITPRLVLGMLALLTFTNLVLQSNRELPDGAPQNYNDTLNQDIQALMFCTIVLNIFSEICKHQLDLEDVAVVINNECKIFMPLLCIVVLFIVLTAGVYKWLSVSATFITSKLIIGVAMAIYVGCSFTSLQVASAEKDFQDEEAYAAQEVNLKNMGKII